MRAVVFGGADIFDYSFCEDYIKDSYIVCCDAGMRHARKLGIKPDIIVGDFDSVDKETLEFYKSTCIDLKKFPCEKDETDMKLGIDAALEAGADNIIIIGGIGSRLDHTISNCILLYYVKKHGADAVVINEKNEIHLVTDKIEVRGQKGDIISLIPMTFEVCGVTTEGLKYSLDNDRLYFGSSLIAVSNVMVSDKACVEIKSGLLYLMKCRD